MYLPDVAFMSGELIKIGMLEGCSDVEPHPQPPPHGLANCVATAGTTDDPGAADSDELEKTGCPE